MITSAKRNQSVVVVVFFLSIFFVPPSSDASLVSKAGHPRGNGVCLQHRELQTIQRGSGRPDGAGERQVPPAA